MVFQPHPDLPATIYKYTSPGAARAILQNGTLQFSRPALFNDDFDLRIILALDINEDVVISRALDQIYDAAYGPEPVKPGNRFGAMLLLMRVLFPGKQPDRAAFQEQIRPAIAELVRNRQTMLRQLCDEVAKETANFKVLCLSATGTTAPMWAGYADNISGAVLQFSPKEDDSFLLTARPVGYVDRVPVLFDDQGFVDWLSGRRSLNDSELYEQFLYTKTADWSHEREWRIVAGSGWKPDDDKEYVGFGARDLEAVIFGTRASAAFREEITNIVGERYPDCRQCELRRSQDTLEYEIVDL